MSKTDRTDGVYLLAHVWDAFKNFVPDTLPKLKALPEYDSIIKNALQELKFSYYVFSMNATSDESVIDYAVNKCNVSANETFKANVKKGITLAEIENQLYKSNSNYFVSKGINSAPAIGLSPMKIYLSLLGTYSGPVFYVNRDSCNVKR